jgi:hypothetical protein
MNVFSMKKYLMTGMAAVVFGGLFTSCSHDIEGGGSEQEQVQKTYKEAFITRFGQPAADLDWGFGSSTKASTRAENKNLNQWGDPAQNGGKAWDVPPALTPEQKLRVRLYFQYNPRLTYIPPTYTDFFVQQVYKGNPATKGPNSAEEYTRVNEETVTGSNEMDYLFCATETTHINDFNNGEWNHGTKLPVLDTGANTNDYSGDHAIEGVSHLDQITLMVNSSAAYIGYGASTADAYKHKDCCALAGAKAIDDWADSDEAKALGLPSLGDPVYDAKWNRSFVGLDFEGLNKEDSYLDPAVTVKASDFRADNTNYVIYQGDIVSADAFNWNIELTYQGEAVKYLDDQIANKAFGEKMKIDGNQVTKSTFTKDLNKASLETQYGKTLSGNNDVRVFNFDQLLGYINEGCAPTYTDKNMIKITGARDYVYSDWIVTLTEAKKVGDTPHDEWETIRVIAEDLTIDSDAEGNSDFDFNDIVFDVRRCTSGPSVGTVQVILKAAGGTLPLYIDGQEVHQLYAEANPTLDIDQYTMINTHAERNGRKGKSGLADIVFTPSNYTSGNTTSTIGVIANSIEVYVMKGGVPCVLEAPAGDVASKIAVGDDFDWCDERQDIDDKYSLDDGTSLFKKYVTEGAGNSGKWYYVGNFHEKQ